MTIYDSTTGIPIVDGNENVKDFHPVFKARIKALTKDPRMRGLLKVESGVRTQAEQIYLWNLYQQGKGNTAANPYTKFQGAYGLPYRKSSWHVVQDDGYGYAVDFNYSALPPDIQNILGQVAAEYGLIRTVFSPQYEPWHFQMRWDDWTTMPKQKEEKIDENHKDWDKMATKKEIEDVVRDVVRQELKAVNEDVEEIRRELQGPSQKRQSRTIREALGALTGNFGV